MLTPEKIQEFIDLYQTNKKNIVREYIQHLFLSGLYKTKGAERLLFKGGTALRIIYTSPRFSEDLDFTGQNIYQYKEIDNLFLEALSEIEKTGISISLKEAKPTSGGYLGLINYKLYDIEQDMKFEVSLRKSRKNHGELVNISSDFIPSYPLIQLPAEEIVAGKMAALFARKKPRDLYDLYFILRRQDLNKVLDKRKLANVLEMLHGNKIDFKKELAILLPASQNLILKNFKATLTREISKYL